MFYLAFENLDIEDYVSEKIYEGLIAGTIPVYRGTRTIERFMPSNSSFINANDLSPKQLANKLIELSKNAKEYNSYFNYKQVPLTKEFQDITSYSYSHPNILCRLCDYYLDNFKKG